jgi:small multidrug resistance pump
MSIANGWIGLGVAIIFGVLGTFSLKLSDGLTKIKPVMCLVLFYITSFIALTLAMRHIELSVVYAVWSGVGTALAAMIGIFYFKEQISARKLACLGLIILGIIGIHVGDHFF